MKKILLLFIIGEIIYLTTPILKIGDKYTKENEVVSIEKINAEKTIYKEENNLNQIDQAIQEMQAKMRDIGIIEDKEQWFIAYKKIIDEYKDILDPPLTAYDYYTDEEIYLIQRVVETECYDQNFISKVNAANVIINRVEDGRFGETVKEVVTAKNQFAYGRENITESTILAVEYAFQIEDTTDGCIAFRSDDDPEEWYGWKYAFKDDAGHNFYREKEK